jgi:glutamine amidotransferase
MMPKLKVVIVDYGVGNTHSVANAIKSLNYRVEISDSEKKIAGADALILPGVGAFDKAVDNLRERNLEQLLQAEVVEKGKPILGICVGMQMMASYSEENGHHKGLNWIPGKVVRLQMREHLPVPHVGWNDITIKSSPIFSRLEQEPHFYFDHSYHFVPNNPDHIAATCSYGDDVTAAVQLGNIYGIQFHPEKSQVAGLKVFRSFLNSVLKDA